MSTDTRVVVGRHSARAPTMALRAMPPANRTVTDSRHFMHLLTPEQRAMGEEAGKTDVKQSRGELAVKYCLELPPPPLENRLSKFGPRVRKWQSDKPFKTLDSYFQFRAGNAWNHKKKQEALERELEADPEEVDAPDATGRTKLMWAAMRGQYDSALQLLGAGATLDLQDIDGWTAVTWATAYGRVELLQLLIDRGANFEMRPETETQWTPFHYGCYMGQAECVRALIKAGCKTNSKVQAHIAGKRWTTGVELAQLQQTDEHEATVLVCNTVKSNVAQAAEDAARASAALQHAIQLKLQQFGKGVSVADANSVRLAVAETLSELVVQMDDPLTEEELKRGLVNKRRSLKVLADCGMPADISSTPRGHAVYPDGFGWSRGLYLGIEGDAAMLIKAARQDVVEAVEAAAAWIVELPETFFVQLLSFHEWQPEQILTPTLGANHIPRGSAARAADNETFVRVCRSGASGTTPFELVADQIVLCSDYTIRIFFTVAEDSTLEGGAHPCPLNSLAANIVAVVLNEGELPAEESSFYYDEAWLLNPSGNTSITDNRQGNSTIASCVIGSCSPGTEPCEMGGVIQACKHASAQLSGTRVPVNQLHLLQHTRKLYGGTIPDPRCCVWKSTQLLH